MVWERTNKTWLRTRKIYVTHHYAGYTTPGIELIVEISGRAFSKLDPAPLQKIRSAEVLHFLKFDHQEVTMILRVEFNEQNVTIEDLFGDDLTEVQLLEQEKEKEGGQFLW